MPDFERLTRNLALDMAKRTKPTAKAASVLDQGARQFSFET